MFNDPIRFLVLVALVVVLAMFVAVWVVVNFWFALALLVVLLVGGRMVDINWISAVTG